MYYLLILSPKDCQTCTTNFYILIREGIRFMKMGPPPVFVKCPRFETP